MQRNGLKRWEKTEGGRIFFFSLSFFFFGQEVVCGVFGLRMQRNGQKRHKQKLMGKDGRFFFPLNFFGSIFSAKSLKKKSF
jgi:hypothetical protein